VCSPGVEGELPTYAICRAYYYGRKHANPVLCSQQSDSDAQRQTPALSVILYQIRMDEGGIATPVSAEVSRKHDLGHLPRHLQACQEGVRLPCYRISLGRVSKREEFWYDVADILEGWPKRKLNSPRIPRRCAG